MIAISNHDSDNLFNDIEKLSAAFKATPDKNIRVKATTKVVVKKSVKVRDRAKLTQEEAARKFSFVIPIVKVVFNIQFIFTKGFPLYWTARKALRGLHEYLKKENAVYSKLSDRQKEDVIIQWEKANRQLTLAVKNTPEFIPWGLKPAFWNIDKLVLLVNERSNELRDNFYGDLNKPRSQEDLKKSASKFKLSKDMVEDLISDKS